MLSSLCRQFSSSLSVGRNSSAACLSTAAAPQSEELVTVLKLNMLRDNPGAVKKVSFALSFSYLFVDLDDLTHSMDVSSFNNN
jgi:hypothetical protein